EGGWWGYSVDAGDFEQLSSHMRGLGAKIRYDYVQSYCDARGLDPGDLTEDEWNAIGDEGIEHVRRQFDERLARKADIEKIQADTLDLMELFREKGLLERSYSNPMYSGHDDLEMLMNRLGNMVETVKRDAGRFELVDATDYDVADPKDRGKLLPRQWVADLIFEWYSNGQEAYQAKLAELGLVDPHPPLAELAGEWSGTWQLTAWEIPPQEGLSVSAPPESGEITLTITVDAGGGTVQTMDTSAPLTYEGGNISFVLSMPIVMLGKNVGTGTYAFTGAVTEGDGGLSINGTYRAEWGLPGWWGEYTWEAHKAG
ncbi:MAG: hypothetical protein JW990_10135, partial [Thermoleophilia bacterium]|nr:hypothetical protein [Thermoleophilia bacterium]